MHELAFEAELSGNNEETTGELSKRETSSVILIQCKKYSGVNLSLFSQAEVIYVQ